MKVKTYAIWVVILGVCAISFDSKCPNGLPSSISHSTPPDIAAWLETGLRPEQRAALLEAEERRLSRALFGEIQLSDAEIEALEKSGALPSTIQRGGELDLTRYDILFWNLVNRVDIFQQTLKILQIKLCSCLSRLKKLRLQRLKNY